MKEIVIYDGKVIYAGLNLDESKEYNIEIKNADLRTFYPLDNIYAKDKNRVYYNSIPLEKADPKTIEVLDNLGNYGYGKDKNHVYYWGKILKGENPQDFIQPPPDRIDL